MKNCSKHFIERWVERIVSIKEKNERNLYISQNRDMIVAHANETFNHAQLLYRGQIGDNVTRNFYIKDDIVFILNSDDSAMITVYKVDLGYPNELNSTVRKELIKIIDKLREEKDAADFQILMELEDKEFQLQKTDDEIKVLEQQLANLKSKRDFTKMESNEIKKRALNVGLELKRYTMMLVNSKDYKADMQNL